MASKRFACCIAKTLLHRLCRLLGQTSSHLECTLIKSSTTSKQKNKKYQAADSTPAGVTAEVTTKLPKLLTKLTDLILTFNISIRTGNTRKKQRVGGEIEACAVVRLRISAAIVCKEVATFHF